MLSGDDAYEILKTSFCSAAKKYEKWSDGSWLSDAGVESVIQTETAERLFKTGKCFVTLETSPWTARSWDAEIPKEKLKHISDTSRFDICIWGKTAGLTGIIEIKRSLKASQQNKDMARMSEMVSVYGKKNDRKLRYAIVGMYLWGGTSDALSKAEANAKSRFDEFAKHHEKSYFGVYPIKPVDKSIWKDWKQSVAIAYFA